MAIMTDDDKRTKIRDFAKYDKNPFTEKWAMQMLVDRRKKETKFIHTHGTVINKDAEVMKEGDLIMGRQRVVDNERFVKIYVGSLMLFNDLSSKAALLFTYMLKVLQKNDTRIYLVPEEMIALMGCSEATYYRAVVELLDSDMLARSDSSSIIYYINPAFIFNGDRMTIVQSFIKDKNSAAVGGIETVDKDNYIIQPHEAFDLDKPLELGEKSLGEDKE